MGLISQELQLNPTENGTASPFMKSFCTVCITILVSAYLLVREPLQHHQNTAGNAHVSMVKLQSIVFLFVLRLFLCLRFLY